MQDITINTHAALNHPFYIVIIAALIIVCIILFLRPRRMPYTAQAALLSPGELRFYRILKNAVPDKAAVMMKVRLADIITCTDAQWRAGWGPRISAKHIDFVLINPKTTAIIMGIELDDSSHMRGDRMERDRFVNAAMEVAGVSLLRVPAAGRYDSNALGIMIANALYA